MDFRRSVSLPALQHLVNKLKHLNGIIGVNLERIGTLDYLSCLVSSVTNSSGLISAPSWRCVWKRSDDPIELRLSLIHITTAIALAGNWHEETGVRRELEGLGIDL